MPIRSSSMAGGEVEHGAAIAIMTLEGELDVKTMSENDCWSMIRKSVWDFRKDHAQSKT